MNKIVWWVNKMAGKAGRSGRKSVQRQRLALVAVHRRLCQVEGRSIGYREIARRWEKSPQERQSLPAYYQRQFDEETYRTALREGRRPKYCGSGGITVGGSAICRFVPTWVESSAPADPSGGGESGSES